MLCVSCFMIMRPKPTILIILDGWGVATPKNTNPISEAKTPAIDKIISAYPAMTLHASGEHAGLKKEEPGNSRAGHLNIGAGRIVYEPISKINVAIKNNSFFNNPAFLEVLKNVKQKNSNLHLVGMLSSGEIESTEQHLFALLKMAKEQKAKNVFIHIILDGKDAIYNSGKDFVLKLEKKLKEEKNVKIASLSGRFYAMDTNNRWDRVERAYRTITGGASQRAKNPIEAIDDSYKKGVFDEELMPCQILGRTGAMEEKVKDNDGVIFFNFGEDGLRELAQAFLEEDFKGFKRRKLNIFFAGMAEYFKGIEGGAFKEEKITNFLAKAISDGGLRQLHIAETEKYAHITFFINGKKEEPFPGEERVVVPSPHVSSYDKKPEMSARQITERVIKEIKKEEFDFYAINFANADAVAHTGDFNSTKRAIEVLDRCVEEITAQALVYGGAVFITSSNGCAEDIVHIDDNKKFKGHTNSPVPFILVQEEYEGRKMGLPEGVGSDLSLVPPVGSLCDVAPTILKILGIKKPKEMTGKSLI